MATGLPLAGDRSPSVRPLPTAKTFAYLKLGAEKAVGPVEVLNLSVAGVAVRVKDPRTATTTSAVQLFHRRQQTWSEHRVEVEYLLQVEGEEFIVSGKFSRELQEDEVLGCL